MKKIFHLIILVGLTSLFTACYKDARSIDPAAPLVRSGSANFTRYVAIGNSLTAGFADGGLYNASIATSYPNLLATQFRLAGGGAFVQPSFNPGRSDGSGYSKMVGAPSATNIRTFNLLNDPTQCGKFAVVGPSLFSPLAPLLEKYVGAPINNFGVPGIRVNQITTPRFGQNRAFNLGTDIFFNPYFERMLSSANATQSYLDFVTAQASTATFFTCWLGNNDVLAYALAGAPDAADFSNDMTTTSVFNSNYASMMTALLANGAKGVVVTIPYVDRAPMFTTITLNGTPGGDPGIRARFLSNGGAAADGVWIQAQGGDRLATTSDLFLLSSAMNYATLGTGTVKYGTQGNPILDIHVLDASEVIDIKARTDAFNTTILGYASANVAVVNINTAILDALASPAGFPSFGIAYRSNFITGGAFSLDGIHLTPAGYAVTANEIIKATNTKFRSAIPLINTAELSTVKFYTTLCQNP